MSDNEIIKALECHNTLSLEDCKHCPLYDKKRKFQGCQRTLDKETLALINRQKAEIERLKEREKHVQDQCRLCDEYYTHRLRKAKEDIASIKAEAYKEFAERWKAEVATGVHYLGVFVDIDNLVEEMVGELQ